MEKMNDIEFVKRCVPFAEDFRLDGDFIRHETGEYFIEEHFPLRPWKKIWLPILLTQTAEGINKKSYLENGRFEIVSKRWGIQIKDYSTDNHNVEYFRYQDLDGKYLTEKAKRSAIEYVLRNSP